jgi:hypothetical protein
MLAMLAAQAFTPHAVRTAKAIVILMTAGIMIFRQRLLYFVFYGVLILFTVAVVVGTVALAQLM